MHLQPRVRALGGVTEINVSLGSERAEVAWRSGEIRLSEILAEIARLGYQVVPYSPDERETERNAENRRALVRLGIAGLGAMQAMMFAVALYAGAAQGMAEVYRQLLRWVSAIVATPVVLVSARPFFDAALRDLRRAQALSPDDPSVRISLAQTLAGLGQTDEALELLTATIQADPKDGRARYERGRIRAQAGERAGARDDLTKALQLLSDDPRRTAKAEAALRALEDGR